MKLSVISPIYNEEGNVTELHRQILESLKSLKKSRKITDFEIIFVNDGSGDRSLSIMETLQPLKIINLRKNFGQTASLDAGIKSATGDSIILIDGDLQNDPADFGNLVTKLNKGYDVVSGWRHKRKDNFSKKFLSRGANMLRKFLVNDEIHDSGCTLKIYRKECFDGIDLQGEMHRFIPAILKWQGFKITEIEVNHRPRTSGTSKYNWKRVVKGFVDMVSIWFWRKYSTRPLHIFGGASIASFSIGILLIFIAIIDKLFLTRDFSNTPLLLLALFMCVTGVIFFVAGILADISIKTYYKAHNRRPYTIKETIENN